MIIKKPKKIKRIKKRSRINLKRGKIDRGTIFIVAIMTSLMFAGYIFAGGTLPEKIPAPRTVGIMSVDLKEKYPQEPGIQLHTFVGVTITPYPTSPGAAPNPDLPSNTVDCGYTIQGTDEPEVLWAYRLASTPASNNEISLQVFYTDEHTLTMGSGSVSPMSQSPADHINSPNVGNTSVRDGNSFPLSPAVFLTDITTNATDVSGDAQKGGIPQSPSDVYGAWKSAGTNDPSTPNGTNLGAGADAWPATNGPGKTISIPGVGVIDIGESTGQQWTAEIIWKTSQLKLNGQPLQSKHTYRAQFAIHDGDRDGDVGSACVTVAIP